MAAISTFSQSSCTGNVGKALLWPSCKNFGQSDKKLAVIAAAVGDFSEVTSDTWSFAMSKIYALNVTTAITDTWMIFAWKRQIDKIHLPKPKITVASEIKQKEPEAPYLLTKTNC